MKVFRRLPHFKTCIPCVLTIGNFDGVHLGHQALLKQVRIAATRLNLNATIITFEPHPREFFAQLFNTPEKLPMHIANLRDKLQAFSKAGLDYVVIEHFNNKFSMLSPTEFIKKILIQGLNVRLLMVGKDFCFGKKRSGNIATLLDAGETYGFEVRTFPNVTKDNIRISSSIIRQALVKADFPYVKRLLGHAYTISGHVVHGRKQGRIIGFPTINMYIKRKSFSLSGIFVVQVHNLKKYPMPAVANLGIRPTVDNSGNILLETHIFDYNGDCYGKLLCIEFLKKIRDEEKYIDIKMLTIAITRDVEQARTWFKKHEKNFYLLK